MNAPGANQLLSKVLARLYRWPKLSQLVSLPAINFKRKFQLKFKTLVHTLTKQHAMELMNAPGANQLLSKVHARL